MNPARRFRGRWIELLSLGAGLALFGWMFREIDLAAVAARVSAIGVTGALLALAPALGVAILDTLGLQRVLAMFGAAHGFAALLRIRLAAEAVAQTLPAGVVFGESLRVALLGRGGRGLDVAVAGTVARKYLLMTSQAAVVVLAVALGGEALEALSTRGAALGFGGTVVLALVGLGIFTAALTSRLLLSRGQVARRVRRLLAWCRGHREPRGGEPSSATDRRLEWFFGRGLRDELRVTVPFAGTWLLESLETWLLLWLVGVPLDLQTVLVLEVVASLLRMAVFVLPGGIGVQDAGYVLLLGALGVPDATERGAAFVVLKRSKELAYAAVGYAALALEQRVLRVSWLAPARAAGPLPGGGETP